MKEQELQTGVLVRHQEWGVGKLVALKDEGQRVVVDFRGRPQHSLARGMALRSLTTFPGNGLEAMLWDKPEELRSWTNHAPLKLIAAALADIGGAGKPRDLKEKLGGRVLHDVKWETWWKRVQPSVRDSAHFQVGKLGSISLLSKIDDVPMEPVRPPAKRTRTGSQARISRDSSERLTAWFQWLLEEKEQPPPGPVPSRAMIPTLDTWPQELLHRAADRILSGVESVLLGPRARSDRAAGVWLEATARVTERWRQCREEGSDGAYLARLTSIAGRLFEAFPNEGGLQAMVSQLAAQAKSGGDARRELASGLWQALQNTPSGTRALLGALAVELEGEVRSSLWHEVLLSSFGGPLSDATFSTVNRLLSMLPVDEQARVIEKLILRSSLDNVLRKDVLSCFSEKLGVSRGPTQSAYFKPLMLAALLLEGGDTHHPVTDQAAMSMCEALTHGPETLADESLSRLLAVTYERISQSQEEEKRRHEADQASYEMRLEQARWEEQRLRQQLHDLRTQLSQRREESTLDIRQDMLLVLGETLQLACQWQGGLQDLVRDVEAGLSLALQAGGAEELGKVGDQVTFDPRLHQAREETTPGTSVRITAPGVLVRSPSSQDRVLLKAQVARSQEVRS